uniref:CSON013860 protein n=1 Tax=Culicoides sonorensis TaxID=179676 RepID=A0A336KSP2_CULSO
MYQSSDKSNNHQENVLSSQLTIKQEPEMIEEEIYVPNTVSQNRDPNVQSPNLFSNQCKVCLKIFGNKGLLQLHSKLHQLEHKKKNSDDNQNISPKTLPIINKNNEISVIGKKKDEIKLNTQKTECKECHKFYKDLDAHSKKLHAVKMIKPKRESSNFFTKICQICKKQVPRDVFEAHFKSHTNSTALKLDKKELKRLKKKSTVKVNKCDFCFKIFNNESALDAHLKKDHSKQKMEFSCAQCNIHFMSKESLYKHISLHHLPPFQQIASTKYFTCEICGKQFATPKILKHHRIEHYLNPYQCEICNDMFKKEIDKNQHKLQHIGTEDHSKGITTNGNSHEQLPSVIVKEEIEISDSVAVQKIKIENDSGTESENETENHEKDQVEIYPEIPCFQCRTFFYSKSELLDHVKYIHGSSEPKIYKCPKCPCTFHGKYVISKHYEMHSEFPFMCDICNLMFKTNDLVESHKPIHEKTTQRHTKSTHDRKTFSCDHCHKKFKSQYYVKVHMKLRCPMWDQNVEFYGGNGNQISLRF